MTNFDFRQFRNAMGTFATGVTVVTVKDSNSETHGMTANSFSSVSLEPPIVSICVDQRAHTLSMIQKNRRFGINILSETQEDISRLFAGQKTNSTDVDCTFHYSTRDIPLIEGALVALECEVYKEEVVGDHTVFFGLVKGITFGNEEKPLCFYKGQYTELNNC